MAEIVIDNLAEKTIEVLDLSKTLLVHLKENAIDWMQACGGKGRCTTCAAIILEGSENLGKETVSEIKYQQQGALSLQARLACQVRVCGTVRIAVPDEYKLPHLKYSY